MQTLNKRMSNGVIYLTSEKKEKYVNAAQALLAMQALQFVIVMSDYMTTSHIRMKSGTIELCVHLENLLLPPVLAGYGFTWKEITSHRFWDPYSKKTCRVRCVTYYFEFKKE